MPPATEGEPKGRSDTAQIVLPWMLNRLRWRCRRGLLELDLVLERFLGHYAATLTMEDLEALHDLLMYPDDELWDLITGRNERYERRHERIVALLRAS